ncbi:heme lyase CcmF/NrfE family subunit [Dehalobacterium formicoaceticum]|uniref:heme lyase CcmF/NrfE family subunit n=1 Tax=Dehalobacterium formicoaceticum TaxID=51515 RepID=UPI0031F6ACF1
MITATFGYGLLILALLAGLYTLYLNLAGLKEKREGLLSKAQLGMAVTGAFVTASSLILLYALLTNDFSLKYVHDYSSTQLPLAYKISAFWAGNAGSLLLWAQMLVVAGVLVTFSHHHRDQNFFAVVSSVILVNIIFFLVSMILFANPFEGLPPGVEEGRGLNPMLRTPWMVIHPVAVYLGYVGWVVPFAFAMASLVFKRKDHQWLGFSRQWAVLSWLFLSIGNLLGAQWAYIELGWGGYWAWDPVENASFLPWLTGTAFLHSLMIQERKGMFKVWNQVLVIITYVLTLYGTFLVRSGILASVHAFPKSNLNYWFGFFMFAMLFWALYLLFTRRNLLKGEQEIIAFFSKETSFLLNNILFICCAVIIFFGTNLPIFSGMLTGVERAVGQEWFNASTGPVLLAIILLIGLCTLIPWKKTEPLQLLRIYFLPLAGSLILCVILFLQGMHHAWSLIGFSVITFVLINTLRAIVQDIGNWSKNNGRAGVRRGIGGHLAHLGVTLFALGVIGNAFYTVETIETVSVGETFSVGKVNDYDITFQGVKSREDGANAVIYTDLLVARNGKSVGTLTPEKIFYPGWESPRTEIVILGGPVEDLYIVLAGWGDQGSEATLEVHVNPLMNWLWIGGYVLILGTLLVLLPSKRLPDKRLIP